MKHKTADLEGALLDAAVAKAAMGRTLRRASATLAGAVGVGLSYADLSFPQARVCGQFAGGDPRPIWIDVGMPIVPKSYLNCVVYLYPDRDSAESGRNVGGTGFVVGVRSAARSDYAHIYVVSCCHTAVRDGHSVLRFNSNDGGTHIAVLDNSEWRHIPNGGDAAAVECPPLPDGGVGKSYVDTLMFVGRGEHHDYEGQWEGLNVGDDVFMLGRFFDADGVEHNKAAARFGHISILPTHLPEIENSDASTQYYCIDMHSRTGFSGSPVFGYRTAAARIEMDKDWRNLNLNPPFCKLLGLHCGQFPEELWPRGIAASDPSAVPLVGYSGMTYVLPAWKIEELLYDPTFVSRRAMIDATMEGKSRPCPE